MTSGKVAVNSFGELVSPCQTSFLTSMEILLQNGDISVVKFLYSSRTIHVYRVGAPWLSRASINVSLSTESKAFFKSMKVSKIGNLCEGLRSSVCEGKRLFVILGISAFITLA
ncbi:hypothetical protein KIN20_029767 [Parelaphostrongylus tenuis]|uniref:Uncharacterized protein n=1 Tax=Parelaphostrongylus tenuis TaxID=148309 RepID=A0AAD5WFW5_PARTN|nr:hypothetical protein KIN20_029767 [Parelaphostrongylus tenuis]